MNILSLRIYIWHGHRSKICTRRAPVGAKKHFIICGALSSELLCRSGWLQLYVTVLGAAQPPVIITENNIQFSNPVLPPPPPV